MIILNAFFAALGQLGDARFRSVLLRGVGLTIVLLVVACVLAIWGINALAGQEISLPRSIKALRDRWNITPVETRRSIPATGSRLARPVLDGTGRANRDR